MNYEHNVLAAEIPSRGDTLLDSAFEEELLGEVDFGAYFSHSAASSST